MDNDDRKARILELGAQTKLELQHASEDYEAFKTQCAVVNPKLAKLYSDAGLAAPAVTQVEIMEYTHVGHEERASEIADVMAVIASITTFAGLTKSMGPAVTKYLKNTQRISEDFADKALVSKSVTVYEDALAASKGLPTKAGTIEIEVTAGDVTGHVIAGMFAGVAVGVLDGIIWATEETVLKKHLQDAITALHPLRTAVYLSRARTNAALGCMTATEAMVDALDVLPKNSKRSALDGIKNKRKNAIVLQIENKLSVNASPSSIAQLLKSSDAQNGSKTGDDPEYKI